MRACAPFFFFCARPGRCGAHARAAISNYCLFHRKKHNATIVALWERQLGKADAAQKLALLYAANDIIQKSRKKGPEYTNEFFKVRSRQLCAPAHAKQLSAFACVKWC